MAILEILKYPEPVLAKVAAPVKTISAKTLALVNNMLETMYAEGGIGLAATQVNVQERVVVMDLSTERNAPLVLINPEILAWGGNTESQEGCLSVPGYFDVV